MPDPVEAMRQHVTRQVMHWWSATEGLADLETMASASAWAQLERYLGVALRRCLTEAVQQLALDCDVVRARLRAARTQDALMDVQKEVVRFRDRYLRTETWVDFYSHAVNTRTSTDLGATLRALDIMAEQSMRNLLQPLGLKEVLVLTYAERGLGASILKANLRLFDGGTLSPVAAVKITFHNRRRPTALIHETGHQVAHIVEWNDELAAALEMALQDAPVDVRKTWASWASEIAADCFAFVNTGYGSVSALSDVVGGTPAAVFRYVAGDPHPVSFLRVLLGVEMCVRCYGTGPWEVLASTWRETYDVDQAVPAVRALVTASVPLLPRIVDVCLKRAYRAFKGKALTELVDPARVSPQALATLERAAGPSLLTSPHWLMTECVRLLALTTYKFATQPERSAEIIREQSAWMARLGAEAALH